MFDLTTADPMTLGRIRKYLDTQTRLNGEPRIMTRETMYAEYEATHKYIGTDYRTQKRYYAIRREPDGLILEVPKMLFDRCTLPLYVRGEN